MKTYSAVVLGFVFLLGLPVNACQSRSCTANSFGVASATSLVLTVTNIIQVVRMKTDVTLKESLGSAASYQIGATFTQGLATLLLGPLAWRARVISGAEDCCGFFLYVLFSSTMLAPIFDGLTTSIVNGISPPEKANNSVRSYQVISAVQTAFSSANTFFVFMMGAFRFCCCCS